LGSNLLEGDFLKLQLDINFSGPLAIIGNFPYNISSQIFFKVLQHRSQVTEVVCMLQREVARRIAAPPGSKEYGILSVLLQAFYNIQYLFTVNEGSFNPPPKVKSGVVRLIRNGTPVLNCNETLFFTVVKTAFNQRRKVLSNSLGGVANIVGHPVARMRPEQLSVEQFVELTAYIETMEQTAV
jgi:16S rRNA (adenine1518-N6/adenine1519-N6)-dimethyltransferase